MMKRPTKLNRALVALLVSFCAGGAIGSASAAVIVQLPSGSLPGDGSSRSFNVTVTTTGTEPIAGYDLTFNIVPRAGATGTLTLTGDWATAPANGGVFGTNNPVQSAGANNYFGYTLSSGTASITPSTPNLALLTISAGAGTSGVFDLVVVGEGTLSALYANDSLDFVPDVSFVGGAIAVPEPASLALVSGMLVLGLRRRR